MSRPLPGRMLRWMKGMMLRHMPMMITCREFEAFILAYIEGELSERQRFIFELHLKVCRDCREYLAAYKRTIEVTGRAFEDPEEPVPGEVPEDLVKAVLDARRR